MKIGKPVSKLPLAVERTSKYSSIWAQVLNLKDGEWLPVICENKEERNKIRVSGLASRTLSLETKSDGLTLYIAKKKSTNPR